MCIRYTLHILHFLPFGDLTGRPTRRTPKQFLRLKGYCGFVVSTWAISLQVRTVIYAYCILIFCPDTNNYCLTVVFFCRSGLWSLPFKWSVLTNPSHPDRSPRGPSFLRFSLSLH